MTDAKYRNFGHYLREGWSAEPKQSFTQLAAHIDALPFEAAGDHLDVGCATGELIGFLTSRYPALRSTGIDVFDELLARARENVPAARFVNASALALPDSCREHFDLVTAVGVASVFDETEIVTFWTNLLAAAKPGGLVAVLSPLNEYGVDTMVRHRKRRDGVPLAWETGWNVFAIDTIREIVASLGADLRIERFHFTGRLEPRPDPVRTWTMATEKDPRQLTNGLKLLVDHYFMLARKPAKDSR
jgi:trans-aconitate methyltransferase